MIIMILVTHAFKAIVAATVDTFTLRLISEHHDQAARDADLYCPQLQRTARPLASAAERPSQSTRSFKSVPARFPRSTS